jgi:hypothetical protein
MSKFDHLVMKVRDAANGGIGHLSTSGALAAALVLNRSDWLSKMGFTIPEALERVGAEWGSMISAAAKVVQQTDTALNEAAKTAAEESSLQALSLSNSGTYTHATLVTYGNSPGYRDVSITLDVERVGASMKHRLCLKISGDDSESIARHILDVQRVAWDGDGPIDKTPSEQRPKWID